VRVKALITSWPFLVALGMTLLNAIKPAVVDDPAYLLFARQIAQHPLDPYGFELFWYVKPEPAMQILAPPVHLYWLAAGLALFGEHLFLLKLWLFPWAWLFCFASWALLKRLAPDLERFGLLFLATLALPMFDFMLDLPALALGLASLNALWLALDRNKIALALVAGLLGALAIQTKYTMLVLPAVLLWCGIIQKRILAPLAAVMVIAVLFGSWELLLVQKYGQSHFWLHAGGELSGSGEEAPQSVFEKLGEFIEKRYRLAKPLFCQFGGLVMGLIPALAWWLRGPKWLWLGLCLLVAVGYALVLLLPYPESILIASDWVVWPKLDWPTAFFASTGLLTLGLLAGGSFALLLEGWQKPSGLFSIRSGFWFLLGWLAIEVAGSLVLSPFPAGRRMLSVALVVVLLSCWVFARLQQLRPEVALRPWLGLICLLPGFGLVALDLWDAQAERSLALQAGKAVQAQPGQTVWYRGHWGFQWYCEVQGMKPVLVTESVLKPGDWLVFPVTPDYQGFYRPYHGGWEFEIDANKVEWKGEWVWDDGIPSQTIPNLYGGWVPIRGRLHPRLRVQLYQVQQEWFIDAKR
jgi:hypothetical protein